MCEVDQEAGDVGPVPEYPKWHKGVPRQLLFTVDEGKRHQTAKDNKTDHLGGAPGECGAAKVQAQ